MNPTKKKKDPSLPAGKVETGAKYPLPPLPETKDETKSLVLLLPLPLPQLLLSWKGNEEMFLLPLNVLGKRAQIEILLRWSLMKRDFYLALHPLLLPPSLSRKKEGEILMFFVFLLALETVLPLTFYLPEAEWIGREIAEEAMAKGIGYEIE